MRWYSYFFAACLGFCAGLWETAIRVWFAPAWQFSPLLGLVILMLMFRNRALALVTALAGSLVLDAFSVGLLDIAFFRWIIIVLMLDLIMHNVLTNRSLPALVMLTFGGRLLERGFAWIIGWLTYWIGWQAYHPFFVWMDASIFFWDIVFVGLGFLFVSFWMPSRRSRQEWTI